LGYVLFGIVRFTSRHSFGRSFRMCRFVTADRFRPALTMVVALFGAVAAGASVANASCGDWLEHDRPSGQEVLSRFGPVAETLASLEGLDAHAAAVSRRLAVLDGSGDR
jgi:hypothetical protein